MEAEVDLRCLFSERSFLVWVLRLCGLKRLEYAIPEAIQRVLRSSPASSTIHARFAYLCGVLGARTTPQAPLRTLAESRTSSALRIIPILN